MPTGAFANLPGMGLRNPINQLNLLKRQIDVLSDAMYHCMPLNRFAPSGSFPAVNLTKSAARYYLRAELPGLKHDDIDIHISGREITLSGVRESPHEGSAVRYHRREREAGRFTRTIRLPRDIDPEKVTAKLKNGLMTVTIAKAQASAPRHVTVG